MGIFRVYELYKWYQIATQSLPVIYKSLKSVNLHGDLQNILFGYAKMII